MNPTFDELKKKVKECPIYLRNSQFVVQGSGLGEVTNHTATLF